MKRALIVLAATATMWMAAPSTSRAQEQAFQAHTAGAWFLTSLELTLMAEIPLSLAVAGDADLGESLLCGALMPLCALFAPRAAMELLTIVAVLLLDAVAAIVVPSVTTAVAAANDTPVDFPIVYTSGVSGALSLGFVGGGLGLLGDAPEIGALAGAALGLAAGLTYSALRLDALARDPRLGVEMNFLMWAPAVVGPLATVMLAAAGADPAVTLLVSGMAGVLAIVASIAAAEVALSAPAPMTAPLLAVPFPEG